ncbi:MAG: HAMP domain-containing histidine kinase [Nitrospirae bacterium]|nr:HAMP domain-containing histidine kinase [Nitrospirota bacterium]
MNIKEYFLSISLNKKLIGMMLFLSLIVISVLTYLYSQSERALMNELEKQTAELSKAIQVGVEEVTTTGYTDEMRLHNYLKKLNAKGVKEISIISPSDEIVASTNPQKIGEQLGPTKKERIIKAELGDPVTKEGKVYNVILPVVAGDAHYGYIHLKINVEDFSEIIENNAIKRIVAIIIVFSIGILLAVILSLMYTKPIHNVVNAAKSVAAGDLTVELATDRKDEIGELTQSFNHMLKKLREEKELEEKLREAEHLSALGQLSKSIAHEIRNPLNVISLSIDHIKKKYLPEAEKEKEQFESLINGIKQEIQRLNKLVGDFLDYGKPMKLNFQNTNIESLINDILDLVKIKAEKDNVKIDFQKGGIPLLSVDPELIKTCIFNIILNAFQAMPDGGEIKVETKTINNKIQIIVRDTGIGVSKEKIPHLFEPFYSTKSNGLGLGLAITKGVIEKHRGKVDFKSEEGKGSIMTITLPINTQNTQV